MQVGAPSTISDTAVAETPDARIIPADRHPERRIDRWYATHHVPEAAVTGYRVTPVEDLTVVIDGRTVELTDHCPIEIDVDERALAA